MSAEWKERPEGPGPYWVYNTLYHSHKKPEIVLVMQGDPLLIVDFGEEPCEITDLLPGFLWCKVAPPPPPISKPEGLDTL